MPFTLRNTAAALPSSVKKNMEDRLPFFYYVAAKKIY